jgi:hypothetical protein
MWTRLRWVKTDPPCPVVAAGNAVEVSVQFRYPARMMDVVLTDYETWDLITKRHGGSPQGWSRRCSEPTEAARPHWVSQHL